MSTNSLRKLEQVADINMGQSPPSETYNKEGHGLPFFQGKAEFTSLHPAVEKWCSDPKKIAEKDDILISVRAPVGAVNIAREECCIGRGLAAIRFKGYNKYLFYYLKSARRDLEKQGTGTTFKAISGKILKDFEIPYPPLPTQHRIVEKIEELFSDLDNGVENLKKAKKQLETYRQAVLKAAFEGKLTKQWREQQEHLPTPEELKQQIVEERKRQREKELEAWRQEVKEWKEAGEPGRKPRKPKKQATVKSLEKKEIKELNDLPNDWIWAKFGQACQLISGQHIKTDLYNEANTGMPYLTGPADFGSKYPQVTKWTEHPKAVASKNGVLVTVKGAGVGKTNINNLNKVVISRQLMSIESNFFLSDYLYYYMAANFQKLQKLGLGSTVPGINRDQILNFEVPICSTDEQKRIVEEIESKISLVEQIETTIDQEIQKAQSLRQSILKKAFEGKLIREEVQKQVQVASADQELTPFQQMQLIGILIKTLEEEYRLAFGEMALAKYLYLIDRIKRFRTGFHFKDWHLGPYDPMIKKLIYKRKNNYFRIGKNSAIELSGNKDKLLKYNLKNEEQFKEGIHEISEIITRFKGKKPMSRQLELLATVCKVVENEDSTDLDRVREGLKDWKIKKGKFKNKAEKFSEKETERCLKFITNNNWDNHLIEK